MHLKKLSSISYGWWVVAACFFISLYLGGAVYFGFTAFFEPLTEEFGWSYAQTSFAASLRGIEIGLLAPIFGVFADRWGSRKIMFGGIVIGGAGLIVMSFINSLGEFYGAFILIAIGMSACSQTVLLTAIVNWFHKNVGIATGIVVSGFALGGILVPVTTSLIDTYEWRQAAVILGIAFLATGLPLSMIVKRRDERHHHKTGNIMESSVIADDGLSSAESPEIDLDTRQALKSRAFWCIALVLVYYQFAMSAVVTHVMPYLSSVGIDRATASMVATATPLVSIGGRLGFGWLGDRFDKRRLVAICTILISAGLLFFSQITASALWYLVPYIIFFGVGWGGNVTMRVALVREYFGRKKFGTMHGFTIGVILLGSITGAPIAGWVFDKWGSYQDAWYAFAAMAVIALAILAATPPAKRAKKSR